MTHRQLAALLVWCWDNLNVRLAPDLAEFAEENKAWLRLYRLPAYVPELNPVERASGRCSSGPWPISPPPTWTAWSASSSAKLKKIQYRAHLIDGCLARTGLTAGP